MTELHVWTRADAASHIKVPTDADDKYSRGVVGLRTGTPAYPGAAVLGVEGAWRAGAGMVRWVGDADVGRLVLARRPETVLADGRVTAWVIGSGTDARSRTDEEDSALRDLVGGDVPVVVDAGALDLARGAAAPLILTPHAGEFARLRANLGLDEHATDARAVAETAVELGHVVLRKGSETLIASPDGRLIAVRAATPWLATAGSGDVLAGVLGALVAQAGARGELAVLAATAAWLHGRAARIAARADAGPGRPIVALDVADALPAAIAEAIAGV
ncbi:ADP-dependent NAD(P)H-hydrate dehydratase [Micromonospora sp. DT81.3]|uniref:ADP-dependent NAD(P)H-hydrate dehydratase n=1 Tax=Actinomycetes TaxID=1760 RepID=UPI003CF50D6A